MKPTVRKGELVARVLAGSWRASKLPPLEISALELDEVSPLLYGSGAAALGWRRLSQTDLRESPPAELLHQAYRLLALQSEIHEEKIERVFRLLRQSSIEAVLAKGWAAAGLYPERTLRPYGDIDLCVHPRHFNLAKKVLAAPEVNDCWIDLHEHFSELADRKIDDVFARAASVSLRSETIRIVGREDHLALSAIHLLKHGAWRPLWLCDIGAAVESLPASFDWETCLGRDQKRAGWIVSAIGLANRLLAANVQALPVSAKAVELPEWLVENVLKHWANPFAINQPPMRHPIPMAAQWRSPRGLAKALRERWPDPILATISVNGRFNSFPRWPYQVANCMSRILRVVTRSPGTAQ
ncbi:MAG TPA: nucleotidyltransferase family protein [Pyrinomonadaceae bacterium]|nr:nucleotidyltransferase family protein [Pyrinomonadaceae bacterium]